MHARRLTCIASCYCLLDPLLRSLHLPLLPRCCCPILFHVALLNSPSPLCTFCPASLPACTAVPLSHRFPTPLFHTSSRHPLLPACCPRSHPDIHCPCPAAPCCARALPPPPRNSSEDRCVATRRIGASAAAVHAMSLCHQSPTRTPAVPHEPSTFPFLQTTLPLAHPQQLGKYRVTRGADDEGSMPKGRKLGKCERRTQRGAARERAGGGACAPPEVMHECRIRQREGA